MCSTSGKICKLRIIYIYFLSVCGINSTSSIIISSAFHEYLLLLTAIQNTSKNRFVCTKSFLCTYISLSLIDNIHEKLFWDTYFQKRPDADLEKNGSCKCTS